jgi:5'-nucleotidase
VAADTDVQAIVDDALARANTKRGEVLGVTLAGPVTKEYKTESAEGDLLTDWMLAAHPDADLALTNGGGLRADIPAGPLTYGALYQAVPFDNRFAVVTVDGKGVRDLIAKNLERDSGILSWSGLVAKARCDGDKLVVDVTVKGKPINLNGRYKIVTSDFLASGGDGGLFSSLHLADEAVQLTDTIIRDAVADVLRGKKTTIDPGKLAMHRLVYSGHRPVRCGAKAAAGAGSAGDHDAP